MPQLVSTAANFLHLLLLAALLPRAVFGEYAVWNAYLLTAIGVTQALNGEADLLRSGRLAAHRDPVLLAGLGAGVLLAVPGYLAQGWPLVCASAAVPALVAWDYWRFRSMRSRPGRLVIDEAAVTVVQVLALLSLRDVVPPHWLPALWWMVGAAGFAVLLFAKGMRPALNAEMRAARAKGAQYVDLIVDAVLAGMPLIVGLQLLLARGEAEEAADLRVVLAVLGPLTVVGLLARRFLFLGLGRQIRARVLYLLAALPPAVTVVYVALLLTLLSTGVMTAVLPEYAGLSGGLVVLLAINSSIFTASSLPMGRLRQAGRARTIRNGRLVGLAPFIALAPWFTSATTVAGASTAYALAYAAYIWIAARRLPELPGVPAEDRATTSSPPS